MIRNFTIHTGHVLDVLKGMESESVHCVVTSPPYWNLRDYGTAQWEGGDVDCDHETYRSRGDDLKDYKQGTNTGSRPNTQRECACGALRVDLQIGLEATPESYVETVRAVFCEIRRVLRSDGTAWLNLGDSYAGSGNGWQKDDSSSIARPWLENGRPGDDKGRPPGYISSRQSNGLKPKDLVGIPWRVAFALQADGWWLRSDIIWAKQNCMPESVTDRPTRSHEYIFLLTKSARYFYDAEAIKEPSIYDVTGNGTAARKARQATDNKSMPTAERAGIRPTALKDASKFNGKNSDKQRGHSRKHAGFNERWDLMSKEEQCTGYRNKRDVWTVAPAQFPDAHFATFPTKLIEPCVLAGCPEGGTVLDPFSGAGTTGLVALRHGRNFIGIDLNPTYVAMATKRIEADAPLFNAVAV